MKERREGTNQQKKLKKSQTAVAGKDSTASRPISKNTKVIIKELVAPQADLPQLDKSKITPQLKCKEKRKVRKSKKPSTLAQAHKDIRMRRVYSRISVCSSIRQPNNHL